MKNNLCIWFDECLDEICDTCEYYSPADDNVEDIIEQERMKFRAEWFNYSEYCRQ